jgi:hypothetical protein
MSTTLSYRATGGGRGSWPSVIVKAGEVRVGLEPPTVTLI